MKTDKSAEIYVHIPFCGRKCDYCDFISFVKGSDVQDRYFDMLINEIRIKSESVGKLPIDSVFFGGGTPSLVSERNIERIMDTLRTSFPFSDDAEITIEMNPNSATLAKISAYKNAGINRISIGLQSTDDTELKKLSRLHSYEEFLHTYDDVRNAGFKNVNVDLMSALPGQTLASYEKTLRRVTELNPEHISAYSLIIEEGTPFYERYKDGKGLPDEDTEREMYYITRDILSSQGYHRYEISNYAKKGYECRHNTGYWTGKPYLGIGIAAASLYDNIRYSKHENLDAYLNGDFSEEKTYLSENDLKEEFVFLGLRMTFGISLTEFKNKFNKSIFDEYGEAIKQLTGDGLLTIENDRMRLTDRGLDVANYCMSFFIH